MQRLVYRALDKWLGSYSLSIVKGLTKVSRKEVVELNVSHMSHLYISLLDRIVLVQLHFHQIKLQQLKKNTPVAICFNKHCIKHG